MGLGSLADVTLAEARDLALRAREKVRAGVDPITSRTAPRSDEVAARTFREVGEEYVKSQEARWESPVHRAQWRSTLEIYA